MTWLLIRALGLVATWVINHNYSEYLPNETIVDINIQYEDEMYRNYLAEQEEIIIEDYFLFLKKIDKINYGRWCVGEYTKPIRSEEKQKRVRCGKKTFDCSWLIKAYWVAKWIISDSSLWKYNSQTIVDLWDKKDGYLAKRGDWTSWKSKDWTHFAVVSKDYDWWDYLLVYDNVNWEYMNLLRERELKVRYSKWRFTYAWKRVIEVYQNWYVEYAKRNNIKVDKWIDWYEEYNPLWFKIVIKWFDYNSIANRISNYWYDVSSWDIDMITTYMWEAHFQSWAIWSSWEKGLCQLLPNKINNVWIKDSRWDDYMRQAEICWRKWEAVADKWKIWSAYKVRGLYVDSIIKL